MAKQIADFSLPSVPINLDALSSPLSVTPAPQDGDDVILHDFRSYLTVIENRSLRFEGPDPKTGEIITVTVPSASRSRYTAAGRKRIKRMLAQRLSWQHTPGVLLTLTVNPARYTKQTAWECMWDEYAQFRKRLWKYLKARGRQHSPLYVAVIESHKSNFPHLHVAYPRLRYLAPREILNRCWKMGFVHVRGGRQRNGSEVTVSPAEYVTKYVGKLSGWSEEALSYLYYSHCRLYNISPRLYQEPLPSPQPGWQLARVTYDTEESQRRARLIAVLRFINKRRRPALARGKARGTQAPRVVIMF